MAGETKLNAGEVAVRMMEKQEAWSGINGRAGWVSRL